jgi:transmembrane sensor
VTNIVEFEARASIENQAREWLICMDGDAPLADTERQALQQWMRRSISQRQELTRICRLWRLANVLTALALVWWGLQRLDETVSGSYSTSIGEQRMIALSDGSSIQMNTDSRLQVEYSRRLRSVHLLRGEALFSVMPDPSRAFEVHANDHVVRALGTAFAVHVEGIKLDVTVTQGAVDVAEAGNAQAVTLPGVSHMRLEGGPPTSSLGQLRAREMASLEGGHDHLEVQRLAESELQRRLAWQEGYLVFSGEPLIEVIEQINRYSPVTLELGDPKLASIVVAGRFRIVDLDAVLDVLHTHFGIQSHRLDKQHIRLDSEQRP